MADIFNMLDTWNASGTVFTGIKLNVTDTASAAGSLLMDLQVGGNSSFKVSKVGRVTFSNFIDFRATASNMGQFETSGFPLFKVNSSAGVEIYGSYLGWNTYGQSAPDTYLYRDAANTLAQRNSTAAQAFNLYQSYTDASNYTRGRVAAASGIVTIAGESAGTGATDIDIALTPKGTGRVRYGTHAAIAAETVTGYIEIKDAGGTVRKIAVVS